MFKFENYEGGTDVMSKVKVENKTNDSLLEEVKKFVEEEFLDKIVDLRSYVNRTNENYKSYLFIGEIGNYIIDLKPIDESNELVITINEISFKRKMKYNTNISDLNNISRFDFSPIN